MWQHHLSLGRAALIGFFVGFQFSLLHAQSASLPPAPIREKLQTTCLECHDTSLIVQQRLSKPGWAKEVDKMVKWGALVEGSDRDAFVDYLYENFPPDRIAQVPRTTKQSRKARPLGMRH